MNRVQFFDSYSKTSSNLWVKYLSESCWKERFNFYESCWKTRVQFCESCFFSTKNRVIKKVQYFDWNFSENQFLESSFFFFKKVWILWHICKKIKVQVFESIVNRRFNSFSYNSEKFLWFMFKKSSILWVIVEKRVRFVDSYWKGGFNALSHIQFFESNWKRRIECFESYWKKTSLILWVDSKKKGSILWIIFRKVQSFESHFSKGSILESLFFFEKVFESYWKNSVQFFESSTKGFNSLRHIQKRGFNSSSHNQKRRQFFASYWKKVSFF